MNVQGSLSGSTTFVIFDSVNMLVSWFESIVRLAETFTVTLFAAITYLNSANPFIATS
jgi:hypothetical protein